MSDGVPARAPRRAAFGDADFDPTIGHEQGGLRPGPIVSVDPFKAGPSTLVFAAPMTRTDRSEDTNGVVSRIAYAGG